MAKSRTVKDLLATAIALAGTIDNVELKAGIEKLEAIEDANGSTQEYKDLKALVATLQDTPTVDGVDGTDGADVKTGDDGVTGDGAETQNGAGDAQNTAQDTPTVEPKKPNYDGVRMIGSKWYCKKDNYKKGFDTANECAEHFNG